MSIVALLVAGLLGLRWLALRTVGRERFVRITEALERGVLTAVILAMVGLSALQILLRNLFSSGLVWVDPLLRHLVLWTCFLGAAAATSLGRHISVDVAGLLLPAGRARTVLHRLSAAAATGVCLLLADGGRTYLAQEREFSSHAFLGLESWQVQSVLYYGFVFLAYRFAVVAIEGVREKVEPGDFVPPGPMPVNAPDEASVRVP